MTQITAVNKGAMDMTQWVAPGTADLTTGFHAQTEIDLTGAGTSGMLGWAFNIFGTGFTYKEQQDGSTLWTGGTVTSFTSVANQQYQVTGISFSVDGFLVLFNQPSTTAYEQLLLHGDDTVQGSTGKDLLYGFAGNDTVSGAAGDDTLGGGTGNDTLDGGVGSDTADFSDLTHGVTISLRVSGAQTLGNSQGAVTLQSIESLRGTAFADVLTGSTADNALTGGNGKDALHLEKGGIDTADGGEGNDILYFGAGYDTADQARGGDGKDVLELNGDYSAGLAIAVQMATDETLRLDAGHNYNLTAQTSFTTIDASALGKHDSLVLDDGLAATVLAGAGDDTITNSNHFHPVVFHMEKGGKDSVQGNTYDDTFYFGASLTGEDTVNGGGGNDVLDLNGDYAKAHIVNATQLRTIKVHGGNDYHLKLGSTFATPTFLPLVVDASALTASNVLKFDGSALLAGDSFDYGVSVIGGAGNDALTGSGRDDIFDLTHGGNDTVQGGGGHNVYSFGDTFTTDDRVVGGDGSDVLALNTAAGDINLSSANVTGLTTLKLQGTHDYTLHLDAAAFEADTYKIQVKQTGNNIDAYHFAFDGSALSQRADIYSLDASDIKTGAGGDKIITDSGDDIIDSGASRDEIHAGAGNNIVHGGTGNDHIEAGGQVFGDGGDDVLMSFGPAKATLNGGAGDDRLDGDFLIMTGGAGNDTFFCHLVEERGVGIYNTITDFDPAHDTIWGDPLLSHHAASVAIGAAVNTGTLDVGQNFITELQTALTGKLAPHTAVAFTPDAGTLKGELFLIVDVDGKAGFGNGDFLVHLTGTSTLDGLASGNFAYF